VPGNIYEGHTLLDTIHALDSGTGDENPLIVMDSDFSSAENPAVLREEGYDYLMVAKRITKLTYDEGFADLQNFTKIENRDQFTRSSKMSSLKTEEGTILCVYSKDHENKETAMIEKIESRLIADLEKLKRSIESGRSVAPT